MVPAVRLAAPLVGVMRMMQSLESFRDAPCRVAFRHPVDWEIQLDVGQLPEPCTYLVRPVALDSLLVAADSVDLHTIRIRSATAPPEVVGEAVGFERRDDRWVISGRLGAGTPGSAYSRADLRGATGYAAVACYRAGGGYAG